MNINKFRPKTKIRSCIVSVDHKTQELDQDFRSAFLKAQNKNLDPEVILGRAFEIIFQLGFNGKSENALELMQTAMRSFEKVGARSPLSLPNITSEESLQSTLPSDSGATILNTWHGTSCGMSEVLELTKVFKLHLEKRLNGSHRSCGYTCTASDEVEVSDDQ